MIQNFGWAHIKHPGLIGAFVFMLRTLFLKEYVAISILFSCHHFECRVYFLILCDLKCNILPNEGEFTECLHILSVLSGNPKPS